jgi:hypothetical protein
LLLLGKTAIANGVYNFIKVLTLTPIFATPKMHLTRIESSTAGLSNINGCSRKTFSKPPELISPESDVKYASSAR